MSQDSIDNQTFVTVGSRAAGGFIPGWYGRHTGLIMAEAFAKAGEIVAELMHDIALMGDSAFWPVAFNYRHAHELILKHILPKAADLADQPLSSTEQNLTRGTHDLNLLWKAVHQRLPACGFAGKDDCEVSIFIAEFSQIDPRGVAFRYSTTQGGELCLEELPDRVSVPHFAAKALASFSCLQGIEIGVSHYLEERNDMRATAGP